MRVDYYPDPDEFRIGKEKVKYLNTDLLGRKQRKADLVISGKM